MEPPPQRHDQIRESIGHREPEPLTRQRPDAITRDTAVGSDVVDPVEASLHRQSDGRGDVVVVNELSRRVVLTESLPEPGRECPGERRRAGLGDGHRRPQHRHPPSIDAGSPPLDALLRRGQLPRVHEGRIGSEDRCFGERHRIVAERAVDHRRRHDHQVIDPGGDGVVEQIVGAGGDALSPPPEEVVVGEAHVDDRVEPARWCRGITRCDHDVEFGRRPEYVGDAPTERAPDASDVHASTRRPRTFHSADATARVCNDVRRGRTRA